jgi:hypothetical protein
VAVVILHVHKYGKKKVTRKFKSGGLHERHVVATWELGNHLSIHIRDINTHAQGEPIKTGDEARHVD